MTSILKTARRPLSVIASGLKKVRIPGAMGATVYDIGAAIFKNIRDLRLAERAAAISFNFLMAIPPSLIFLVSLVPFLPLDSVQQTILDSIRLLSPNPLAVENAGTL